MPNYGNFRKVWKNGVHYGREEGRWEVGGCGKVLVPGNSPRPNRWWLVSCAEKYHARNVGLGENGYTNSKERGIPQGGRNLLLGSGSSDTAVWFGDVGPFISNVEEGRQETYRVPQTNHREASAAVRIQDIGDAWGGSSAVAAGTQS